MGSVRAVASTRARARPGRSTIKTNPGLATPTRTLDTTWTIPAVVEELAGASHTDVTPDAGYMVMMMAPPNTDPDIYESHR